MRVLNENSEYTQGDFGRVVDIPYKVIAGVSLESDEYTNLVNSEDFDEEKFKDEHQEAIEDKLNELGYDYYDKPVVVRYLDKPDSLYIQIIDDAVQALALKDGSDLVQFKNGNIGFVGYYNDYKNNAFEILRNATEEDFEAEDNGIDIEEYPEDYDFGSGRYTLLDRKSVADSDGFYTDYSLYKDEVENIYVCVFGDSDIYRPEDENFDAEFEYEDEAYDWFDNYKGFDEE
jgi:hypothetical protein